MSAEDVRKSDPRPARILELMLASKGEPVRDATALHWLVEEAEFVQFGQLSARSLTKVGTIVLRDLLRTLDRHSP